MVNDAFRSFKRQVSDRQRPFAGGGLARSFPLSVKQDGSNLPGLIIAECSALGLDVVFDRPILPVSPSPIRELTKCQVSPGSFLSHLHLSGARELSWHRKRDASDLETRNRLPREYSGQAAGRSERLKGRRETSIVENVGINSSWAPLNFLLFIASFRWSPTMAYSDLGLIAA